MCALAKEGTHWHPGKYIDFNLTGWRDFVDYLRYYRELVGSALDGRGAESEWRKQLLKSVKGN